MKESCVHDEQSYDLKNRRKYATIYGRRFIKSAATSKIMRFGMVVSGGQDGVHSSDGSVSIIVLAQTLLHILAPQVRSLGNVAAPQSQHRQILRPLSVSPGPISGICNLSQPCPETQSEKLLHQFLELLLQHAKTSNLLAPSANVPSRCTRAIGQGIPTVTSNNPQTQSFRDQQESFNAFCTDYFMKLIKAIAAAIDRSTTFAP